MMKLFGKNNDLRTEEGRITKLGYEFMLLSSVFGLCVFLTGSRCGRSNQMKLICGSKRQNRMQSRRILAIPPRMF